MTPQLHARMSVRKLRFGREQARLLVIDNFVADPEGLAMRATGLEFRPVARAFPGVRALAPSAYQRLLVEALEDRLLDYFELNARKLRLSLCHYSLVTMHAEELAPLQRVPHVDMVKSDGLATVHYLFRGDMGGTSFYRHRTTGFEFVDEAREQPYVSVLKAELDGPDKPPEAYINGDTALFECINSQPAAFNRMLVYKRNSLHSGSIAPDFIPDPRPATGRLSINSFIDAVA